MNPYTLTLGQNIRAAREKMGLSRDELSNELLKELKQQGASKQSYEPETLRNWEKGRNQPPIECLLAFRNLFNVSLDYLITGQDFDRDDDLAYLKTVYQKSEPELKCLVIDFAKIVESLTNKNNQGGI